MLVKMLILVFNLFSNYDLFPKLRRIMEPEERAIQKRIKYRTTCDCSVHSTDLRMFLTAEFAMWSSYALSCWVLLT